MARKPVLEGGKKDELLEAALALFFENGYENTSIRQITDKVGCEVGLFYYYFKNKDEAFERAIDRFFSRYLPELEALAGRAARDPYRVVTELFSRIAGETESFRRRYAGRLHWTVRWAIRERTLQILEPYMLRLLKTLSACGMELRIGPEAASVFLTHGIGGAILHESQEDYSEKRSELRRGVNLLLGVGDEEAELLFPYYAGYGDIAALKELFSAEKALFPALAQSAEKLLPARISDREVFILRQGGRLAGALLFSRERRSLDALLVAPEHRRRGAAERLTISALAQFAAGEAVFVSLPVPEGSPAESLLKKFGLRRQEGRLCVTAPENVILSHTKQTAEERKHA